MFGKKAGMSDSQKKAKLAALKDAHGMASDMMKDGLSGAKKVSVIAKDDKGLKKGLDMAEKIVGEQDDEDEVESDMMDEAQEGYEDQQEESSPLDEDEIDAEIQKLMELKSKLQNS